MYRGRAAAYLLLLVLAMLAMLLFLAFMLGLETPLLMLYMVGVVRPSIATASAVIAYAVYQALRPQRDRTLLLLSAMSFAVLLLVASPAPTLSPLLLAYAALTGGLAVYRLWGREGVLTSAIAVSIPAFAFGLAAVAYSPARARAELAQVRVLEAEVTGTLRWEKEGPALVAERNRLYDVIQKKRRQFPVAVIVSSAMVAAGSFASSFLLATYRRALKLEHGMMIGSVLSIVQTILAVCWFAFWR